MPEAPAKLSLPSLSETRAKTSKQPLSRLCPSGHPLKERDEAFGRYTNTGLYVQGDNITCNSCSGRIDVECGYFRCEHAHCDYDICYRCGLAADLDREEVKVEADSKLNSTLIKIKMANNPSGGASLSRAVPRAAQMASPMKRRGIENRPVANSPSQHRRFAARKDAFSLSDAKAS